MAMTVTARLAPASSSIVRRFEDLITRFPDLTAQAMFTSADAVLIPAIRNQIRKNRSVYRGHLHQRISARVTKDGTAPALDVGAIGVPYSEDVELGSGPEGLSSTEKMRIGKYVRQKMGYTGEEAALVAQAIIETIETEGRKPHPFLLNTWEATKEQYFVDVVARIRAKIDKGGV